MVIQPHHAAVARNRIAAGGGGSSLLDGLLEWWPLDETSGNALSAGGSGGNDLTDNNTVSYTSAGAPNGQNCRQFTATNSEKFSSAAGNIWTTGSATTIAFWANVTDNGLSKYAFGHNAPNGYSSMAFTSSEYPYVWFDSSLSAYDLTAVSDWNSWIVTSTGPGGNDYLYKDNSQIASGTAGWEPGSAAFYLGASQYGLAYFNGEMATAAIWDRVLTASERSEWHNSGSNLVYADL